MTTTHLAALARELRLLDTLGNPVPPVHLSRWARTIEEHICADPGGGSQLEEEAAKAVAAEEATESFLKPGRTTYLLAADREHGR
jgi:hypothetical protein